jgi:hypothetical protein
MLRIIKQKILVDIGSIGTIQEREDSQMLTRLRNWLAAVPVIAFAILIIAPGVASGYPKAPCEEGEGDIGRIQKDVLGLSSDGTLVAILVDFEPENLVCGSSTTDVEVRTIDSGKVLWTGPFKGNYTGASGAHPPLLRESLPPEQIAKFQLQELVPAQVKATLIPGLMLNNLEITGSKGVRTFELYFPSVVNIPSAWLAGDRLVMAFELYKQLKDGSKLESRILLTFPLEPGLSKAGYEKLRERVQATADIKSALETIANEAYRAAGNTFAAEALAYEVLNRAPAKTAPEQYLATVSEITFYHAKQKEAGVESCVYVAEDALGNPALKGQRFEKLRKMIKHNLQECKKFSYKVPETP